MQTNNDGQNDDYLEACGGWNFKMQTWFKIKTKNSCITKLYENENGLL